MNNLQDDVFEQNNIQSMRQQQQQARPRSTLPSYPDNRYPSREFYNSQQNNYPHSRLNLNSQSSQNSQASTIRDRSPLDNQQFTFPQRSASVAPQQMQQPLPIGFGRAEHSFRPNSVSNQSNMHNNQANSNVNSQHAQNNQNTCPNFQNQYQNDFQAPQNGQNLHNFQNQHQLTNNFQVPNFRQKSESSNIPPRIPTNTPAKNALFERMQTQSTIDNDNHDTDNSFITTATSEITYTDFAYNESCLNDSYYHVSNNQRKRIKASNTPIPNRYSQTNRNIEPFLTVEEKSEKENKKKWKTLHSELTENVNKMEDTVNEMHKIIETDIIEKFENVIKQAELEKSTLLSKIQVEKNAKIKLISEIKTQTKDVARGNSYNEENYGVLKNKIRGVKSDGGIGHVFIPTNPLQSGNHNYVGDLKNKPFAENCRVILPQIYNEREIFIDGNVLEVEIEANDFENKPISKDIMNRHDIGFRFVAVMVERSKLYNLDYGAPKGQQDTFEFVNVLMTPKIRHNQKVAYQCHWNLKPTNGPPINIPDEKSSHCYVMHCMLRDLSLAPPIEIKKYQPYLNFNAKPKEIDYLPAAGIIKNLTCKCPMNEHEPETSTKNGTCENCGYPNLNIISKPWGVCIGNNSLCYLTNRHQNNILVFNYKTGEYKYSIGEEGTGTSFESRIFFKKPAGIVYDDKKECLIVADKDNHRIQIIALGEFVDNGFNMGYRFLKSIGGKGSKDGEFDYPWGLGWNRFNRLLAVADSKNNRVQIFNEVGEFIFKVQTDGAATHLLPANPNQRPNPKDNRSNTPATVFRPRSCSWVSKDHKTDIYQSRLLVTDFEGYRIVVFDFDINEFQQNQSINNGIVGNNVKNVSHQLPRSTITNNPVNNSGNSFGNNGLGKHMRNNMEPGNENHTARNLSKNSDLNATLKVVVSLSSHPGLVGSFGKTKKGHLDRPNGIISDRYGNWIIADTKNGCIQVFGNDGKPRRKFHPRSIDNNVRCKFEAYRNSIAIKPASQNRNDNMNPEFQSTKNQNFNQFQNNMGQNSRGIFADLTNNIQNNRAAASLNTFQGIHNDMNKFEIEFDNENKLPEISKNVMCSFSPIFASSPKPKNDNHINENNNCQASLDIQQYTDLAIACDGTFLIVDQEHNQILVY